MLKIPIVFKKKKLSNALIKKLRTGIQGKSGLVRDSQRQDVG
jgi:hypothetical protein